MSCFSWYLGFEISLQCGWWRGREGWLPLSKGIYDAFHNTLTLLTAVSSRSLIKFSICVRGYLRYESAGAQTDLSWKQSRLKPWTTATYRCIVVSTSTIGAVAAEFGVWRQVFCYSVTARNVPFYQQLSLFLFLQDICGFVCAFLTWGLLLFAEFVVMRVILLPCPYPVFSSINIVIFQTLAFLAFSSHLRTMLSDPVSAIVCAYFYLIISGWWGCNLDTSCILVKNKANHGNNTAILNSETNRNDFIPSNKWPLFSCFGMILPWYDILLHAWSITTVSI